LTHSSDVRKLLRLPLQPPKLNVSHFWLSPLKPHLKKEGVPVGVSF
jgi:hypothetical protein